MSKPELARRAGDGQLDYRDDLPGRHWWYREDQINELAKAKLEADRAKAAKPKRVKSDKQKLREALNAPLGMAPKLRDGPFTEHSLRLNIPRDKNAPKNIR